MIPCELLQQIFSKLHSSDIARARAVSRYWLKAADDVQAGVKCQLREEWRESEQFCFVKAAIKRGLAYVREDASACLTVQTKNYRSYVVNRATQPGLMHNIATAFSKLFRPTAFSGEDKQLKMYQMIVHGPMTGLDFVWMSACSIHRIFIRKHGEEISLYQDCGLGYCGRLESQSEYVMKMKHHDITCIMKDLVRIAT